MTDIELKITDNKKIILTVLNDKPERFADCSVKYIDNENETLLDEYDFLYVFVGDIYIGTQNIYSLKDDKLFGTVGWFMSCYLFDDDYNEKHRSEIDFCEKSSLFSTSTHNIFIYEFSGKLWLEIDVDYENNPNVDEDLISPMEYHSDCANYRVLFTEISRDTISEWQRILKPYYDIVRI